MIQKVILSPNSLFLSRDKMVCVQSAFDKRLNNIPSELKVTDDGTMLVEYYFYPSNGDFLEVFSDILKLPIEYLKIIYNDHPELFNYTTAYLLGQINGDIQATVDVSDGTIHVHQLDILEYNSEIYQCDDDYDE